MAWTYSDWDSATYPDGSAARLARLALFMQELRNAVSLEVAGDGKSKSANNITQLLLALEKEKKALETRVARRAGAGTSLIRLRGVDQDGRVDSN